MKLSYRLQAVADYVTPGLKVADIGTDHGYIPIYLLREHISPSAIAMDINEGPILRAKEHISMEKLEDKIDARISDGFEKLRNGEAECAVIAGMGGELIVRILENGKDIVKNLNELVLSPHSEIFLVRKYLHKINFKIIEEKMLVDEEKYYTVIKAVPGKDKEYTEIEYKYGALLIENKSETLKNFLIKQNEKYESIVKSLEKSKTQTALERLNEIENEKVKINGILKNFIKESR